MKKIAKYLFYTTSVTITLLVALIIYYTIKLPDSYYVSIGKTLEISSAFSVNTNKIIPTSAAIPNSNSYVSSNNTNLNTEINSSATLKLFGVIPIKTVAVNPIAEPLLIPGGTPFGLKMLTKGVMVIGLGDVNSMSQTNDSNSSAARAGIKIGDVIITMNGIIVNNNSDVANVISQSQGSSIDVVLCRNSEMITLSLCPAISPNDGMYEAGMWVRDSSAGVGTITFYNPLNGTFGGLGHPVCDVDTGNIIPLQSGEVVDVVISGVTKGSAGAPGELLGRFASTNAIGELELNNRSGLFGKLYASPDLSKSPAIPMAWRHEIKLGDAEILSTIRGSTPKSYKVKIEKLDLRHGDEHKNMVIKIVDPELLSISGGIVQGMSGSPIIQNNKIVGAVTHVFVNDPTKGYAIFADTMYNYTQTLNASSR